MRSHQLLCVLSVLTTLTLPACAAAGTVDEPAVPNNGEEVTMPPNPDLSSTSSAQANAPIPEGAGACGNHGTSWALFKNTFGGNNDPTYSTFDPSSFATQSPLTSGLTHLLGGLSGTGQGGPKAIYGRPVRQQFFAVNQVGYIYARTAGTYTANIQPDVDDIVFVWLGPNAYSGYTRENANATLTYQEQSEGVQSATVEAVAGDYIPFRFVFGQAGGPYAFDANITAPDNSLLLGPNSARTPNVVRYSCDGTTAPSFPSWGGG